MHRRILNQLWRGYMIAFRSFGTEKAVIRVYLLCPFTNRTHVLVVRVLAQQEPQTNLDPAILRLYVLRPLRWSVASSLDLVGLSQPRGSRVVRSSSI